MNISLFDVIGPVMVGPSSSHTAGAVRLARTARMIAARPFSHVSFGLHGSFAQTYKGHGTDRALVAGALGFYEDDERVANAFEIAREEGLAYDFYETELEGMHENSVVITFRFADGYTCEVAGSSIGGAQIVIRRINGFDIEFMVLLPTLLVQQEDRRGIVSEVSRILAMEDLNIGVMKLSRKSKGGTAFCAIETDEPITEAVVEQVRNVPGVRSAQAINPGRREPEDVSHN